MSNPFTKLKSKGSTINEILDAPLTININLDDIEVRPQIRKKFDGDHTVAGLSESIKKSGVMQAIGVWVHPTKGNYILIWGERRCRASRLAGLTQIPAKVYHFPEEGAEQKIRQLQYEENVHRKNLEQEEEANALKAQLDHLGSVEELLSRNSISRAWYVKAMAILDLPETTKRLVSEKISSDKELLYAVATIEREDPAKAEEIVERLKESDKSTSARKIVKEVKDRGKPEKPPKVKAKATDPDRDDRTGDIFAGQAPSVTTARPVHGGGGGDILAGMGAAGGDESPFTTSPPPTSPAPTATANRQAKSESQAAPGQDAADAREWFDKGHRTSRTAPAVMKGLREGTFGMEGRAARRLAAFLSGADAAGEEEFSADEIEKML